MSSTENHLTEMIRTAGLNPADFHIARAARSIQASIADLRFAATDEERTYHVADVWETLAGGNDFVEIARTQEASDAAWAIAEACGDEVFATIAYEEAA